MIFYCFFQLIIKRKFFDPKFNGGKTEIESFRSLLFYDILYINTENFFLKPLEIKEKMYGINRISEYQTISTEYILPSLMRIASGFASP